MVFKIIWTSPAEDDLNELEHFIRKRIIQKIDLLISNPFNQNIKKLTGLPYYRLRIGDYRIIFDIQQEKLIILIIHLGHRKNIYT